MNKIEYHKAANLLPMMDADEFRALKKDIKTNGCLEPIYMLGSKIVDGRNRFKACVALGIEPPFKRWKEGGQSVEGFVMSKNLHRRHLNESQRAMVAADLATYKKGRPKKGSIVPIKTNSDVAELLNVSSKSIKRAKTVKSKGTPELNAKVRQGAIAVSTAIVSR